MLGLEEELKKVEAKLLAAVREKTGLTASVITLERQQAELKKINEFLKNKVCVCFFFFKSPSLALKCLAPPLVRGLQLSLNVSSAAKHATV